MGDGIASQLSPTRCWVRRRVDGRREEYSGQGPDGGWWERIPLAGETEAAINKASVGMVPIMCYCDTGGMGRFGAEGLMGGIRAYGCSGLGSGWAGA